MLIRRHRRGRRFPPAIPPGLAGHQLSQTTTRGAPLLAPNPWCAPPSSCFGVLRRGCTTYPRERGTRGARTQRPHLRQAHTSPTPPRTKHRRTMLAMRQTHRPRPALHRPHELHRRPRRRKGQRRLPTRRDPTSSQIMQLAARKTTNNRSDPQPTHHTRLVTTPGAYPPPGHPSRSAFCRISLSGFVTDTHSR